MQADVDMPYPYRSPKYLVMNLVMNLVTNLVITKFSEELGDIFVTLFDDSPNWVMILVTFLSPYSSLNLVVNKFVTKIMTNFTTTKKSSHAA